MQISVFLQSTTKSILLSLKTNLTSNFNLKINTVYILIKPRVILKVETACAHLQMDKCVHCNMFSITFVRVNRTGTELPCPPGTKDSFY